jgi:mono/diheme cytochrome c family protein
MQYLNTIIATAMTATVLLAAPVLGQDNASDDRSPEKIKSLMAKYCFECHNADDQNGDIQLDHLSTDLTTGNDAEGWHAALDVINSGDMPPDDAMQPTEDERELIVDWITESLDKAADAKKQKQQTAVRRLTRSQYTNSLQQLLGVPVNFGDVLPADGKSEMGFSNNGDVLQTTSLHLDYYEKIARQALDQAIVIGDQPKPLHYKVTFGTNIDRERQGAEVRGYQETPILRPHFLVERVGGDKTLPDERDRIGVGMRGSASDRYLMTPGGMLLYSAVPHREQVPKSWQGPSPNIKLLFMKNFPREGNFRIKVHAARSNAWDVVGRRDGLISLRDQVPAKQTQQTIKLTADACTATESMELKDGWLRPKSVAKACDAKFEFETPETALYQIDFVHPYAEQALMPSYQIVIDGYRKQERLQLDDADENSTGINRPVTLIQLEKGKHSLSIGGRFFVGFREVTITPLPDDHPVTVELNAEINKNKDKFENKTPSLRAFAGGRTDDGMDYGTFDESKTIETKHGTFTDIEFFGRLENLPLPFYDPASKDSLANISIVGIWNDYLVKHPGDSGPPILVKSIEVEAPYYPNWPPRSHTEIFFPPESPSVEFGSDSYTRQLIESFASRAFRRPVKQTEVERYFRFWQAIKSDHDSYEAGIKETLVALLCSPNFLYMVEPAEPTDQFQLASKLAFFLWNSPPDQTTLNLAGSQKLRQNLRVETQRLLDSPHVRNMVEGFAYEWLRIDRHENMSVNIKRYPRFTRFVKSDMAEETYQFLHHVLDKNLNINSLIESDFAMLNQNLAEFYGVDGVTGNHFRPVKLPPGSHRGGLLSQGAFLTGHSDGTDAHPIKRAVWVKEKILGDPPPPPPPNVPELDPDTPGFDKLTLKQKLELHRDKDSCRNCHQKIDPFGVVFENYDAVGHFRPTRRNKLIDATSVLPDGTAINGVAEIKEYILQQKQNEFATSLVEHLFAYATGRDVTFADEKEIQAIVDRARQRGNGLRTVVEELIMSSSFRGQAK